jgi:hypothetical protein
MSDDNGKTDMDKSAPAPEKPAVSAPSSSEPAAKPAQESRRASFLGRVLWLGPRVTEARATTFVAGQPGFAAYDIARQLCDDVVKIGETGKGSWAVLLLDCTAVELLTRAHLERAGQAPAPGPLGEADWERARALPSLADAWGKLTVENSAILTGMLGHERDATMAKLTEQTRETFAAGLHELVMRLAEPLELDAHRLGRALFARWSRLLIVVVILALASIYGGKWLSKKYGKPNIALHASVLTSSQFPGQGTDHALLVDGDPDTLGFHTLEGGQQWAIIDLGKVRKFDKIVVYNRPDGYEERAVPLKVEVSKDGQNYTQIAERKESFDKWTARGLHAEARYVRLKNNPGNFFHLAEVELY